MLVKCMSEQRFCFASLWDHEDNEKDLDWKFAEVSNIATLTSDREYLALGDEVCAALSFQDYYTIKFGSQPKDLDQDFLKNIVWGVEKDEPKVQVDGELDLKLTVHDEDVHEEIALEPSCEPSNTSTSDSQIVDKSWWVGVGTLFIT